MLAYIEGVRSVEGCLLMQVLQAIASVCQAGLHLLFFSQPCRGQQTPHPWVSCYGALAADGRGVPALQEVPNAAPPPTSQRRAHIHRSPCTCMCLCTSIEVWVCCKEDIRVLSQHVANVCSHAVARLCGCVLHCYD